METSCDIVVYVMDVPLEHIRIDWLHQPRYIIDSFVKTISLYMYIIILKCLWRSNSRSLKVSSDTALTSYVTIIWLFDDFTQTTGALHETGIPTLSETGECVVMHDEFSQWLLKWAFVFKETIFWLNLKRFRHVYFVY